MKKTISNLVLFLLSLLVVALSSEFALESFYPIKYLDVIFEKDDILPYRLRKHSNGGLITSEFNFDVSINSLGYRGIEFVLKKDKKRILIIGDSFTFGYGVNDDEAYPSLLNQLFEKDNIEVFNAGFQGCYTPDTYYLYLTKKGIKLKPDILIVGLFIGNDIEHPLSNSIVWTKIDSNGLPTRIIDKYSNNYFVKNYLFRYQFIRNSNLIKLFIRFMDKIEKIFLGLDKDKEWLKNSNDFISIYRVKYSKKTEKRFNEAKKMILAISDFAKKNDNKIIFVLIPELLQIDSSKIPNFITNIKKLEIEKPQRILIDFFNTNGINYIDLLPELRQYQADELYYLVDRHWNKNGHNVASAVIYNYLQKSGL